MLHFPVCGSTLPRPVQKTQVPSGMAGIMGNRPLWSRGGKSICTGPTRRPSGPGTIWGPEVSAGRVGMRGTVGGTGVCGTVVSWCPCCTNLDCTWSHWLRTQSVVVHFPPCRTQPAPPHSVQWPFSTGGGKYMLPLCKLSQITVWGANSQPEWGWRAVRGAALTAGRSSHVALEPWWWWWWWC